MKNKKDNIIRYSSLTWKLVINGYLSIHMVYTDV